MKSPNPVMNPNPNPKIKSYLVTMSWFTENKQAPSRRIRRVAVTRAWGGGRAGTSPPHQHWVRGAPGTRSGAWEPGGGQHVAAGATSAWIAAARSEGWRRKGSGRDLGFRHISTLLYETTSVCGPWIMTNGPDCSALGFLGMGQMGRLRSLGRAQRDALGCFHEF